MDISAGGDCTVAAHRSLARTRNQQVTRQHPKSSEEAAFGGWRRGDTSPRRGCCRATSGCCMVTAENRGFSSLAAVLRLPKGNPLKAKERAARSGALVIQSHSSLRASSKPAAFQSHSSFRGSRSREAAVEEELREKTPSLSLRLRDGGRDRGHRRSVVVRWLFSVCSKSVQRLFKGGPHRAGGRKPDQRPLS